MKRDTKRKRRYAKMFYFCSALFVISFVTLLVFTTETLYLEMPTDTQRLKLIVCVISILLSAVNAFFALNGYCKVSKTIECKKRLKFRAISNQYSLDDYDTVVKATENKLFETTLKVLNEKNK